MIIQDRNKQPKQKTSINTIMKRITRSITSMGLNVTINFSAHSQSRYLHVFTGREIYKIRISDHPFYCKGRYDFDVYTRTPRKGARNYADFLNVFRKIIEQNEKVLQ